jgi:hypothetical protein
VVGARVPSATKLQTELASGSGRENGRRRGALTFSKPKNLSLPSLRRGPALTRSFSSGVGSGALGSFLAGVVPAAGLVGAYSAVSESHCGPGQAAPTLPDLRRPKNEVMAGALVERARRVWMAAVGDVCRACGADWSTRQKQPTGGQGRALGRVSGNVRVAWREEQWAGEGRRRHGRQCRRANGRRQYDEEMDGTQHGTGTERAQPASMQRSSTAAESEAWTARHGNAIVAQPKRPMIRPHSLGRSDPASPPRGLTVLPPPAPNCGGALRTAGRASLTRPPSLRSSAPCLFGGASSAASSSSSSFRAELGSLWLPPCLAGTTWPRGRRLKSSFCLSTF